MLLLIAAVGAIVLAGAEDARPGTGREAEEVAGWM